MKKVIAGILIALACVFVVRSCTQEIETKAMLQENTMLIQQQIENVSKLIVTEGHFAEVYNYKDSKELFGPLITADKKALVVVNADVSIAYDLSKMNFEIDEEGKKLYVKSIPKAEIKLNPDFEYYDVTADYLNPFDANDYNAIKQNVNTSLMKKVRASSLLQNSENRLMSELQQLLIVTNSMGWEIIYNSKAIDNFASELDNDF